MLKLFTILLLWLSSAMCWAQQDAILKELMGEEIPFFTPLDSIPNLHRIYSSDTGYWLEGLSFDSFYYVHPGPSNFYRDSIHSYLYYPSTNRLPFITLNFYRGYLIEINLSMTTSKCLPLLSRWYRTSGNKKRISYNFHNYDETHKWGYLTLTEKGVSNRKPNGCGTLDFFERNRSWDAFARYIERKGKKQLKKS